jgi:hypothetical protein
MSYGWSLYWSHGCGFVERVGGMLGPVYFRLDDGRQIQPFATFPWADETPPSGQPPLTGLMKRGRGEWPCVPFGLDERTNGGVWRPPIHGEPAHGEWRRIDDGKDPACVRLRYDCGPNGPIDALEREIRGVDGVAAVDCSLIVLVRQHCDVPVGLHPTLRLPERPGALKVQPGAFAFGLTYPKEVEPGADIVASGRVFATLGEVPRADGDVVDLRNLPLVERTESIVQLCDIDGSMTLHNEDEQYRFSLQWNPEQLPSCLLWISNRGRSQWPWGSRHLALGIEPVCANFDLGVAAGTSKNAASERGVATSMRLSPDEPLVIDYRLSVDAA